MKVRRSFGALAIVSALTVGATGATSAAAPEGDPDNDGLPYRAVTRTAPVSEHQAEIWAQNRAEELAAYAKSEGISEELAAARMAARAAVNDAVIATKKDPFTGSYFTHDAKSYVFHIVVKEGAQPPVLDIPESDVLDVVWETAPRSRSEMLALRSQVAKELGQTFVRIGTDVAPGRVVLYVEDGTDAAPLVAQYGDFMDVRTSAPGEQIACADVNACTPWRGGIQIQSQVAACSYGFTSRGSGTGNMRMLSADHCNHVNGNDYTWYHNGTLIGTSTLGMRGLPGDFFKAPRPAGSTPRNYVYYTDNQKNYVINSVPVESSQDVGDPIHFSGFRHLGTDGEITDDAQCWFVQGNLVCGAIATTEMFGNPVTLGGGDSGGPLYYGGGAFGIASTAFSGTVGYSFVTRAEDELSVLVCINSACDI